MTKQATITNGYPIAIDKLLETRLLIQAASGFGKSWALRRLLEQTAPLVQQLIIDPEDEFSTLREKYDYVICAPHDADAIATPHTAALLARRLLETGVSAILNIYDLKKHERAAFVSRFLTELVNAPKRLWHPVLVVIDEAHMFAPEQDKAESLGAVIDIATRGRKRGQGLVVATQRLSKLHKDVAAEMLNKMIGMCGIDVDIKRAAGDLGITPKDLTAMFKGWQPGEFFVYGPALRPMVEKVTVGGIETSHPKAGDRMMQPPPPPSIKIKGMLAELVDLPQQAEAEIRSIEDFQREIATLRRQLQQRPEPSLAQSIARGEEVRLMREHIERLEVDNGNLERHRDEYVKVLEQSQSMLLQTRVTLQEVVERLDNIPLEPDYVAVQEVAIRPRGGLPKLRPGAVIPMEGPAVSVVAAYHNGRDITNKLKFGAGEQAVLTAIAQHKQGVDREQIGILTGYVKSTRDAYILRLRQNGYIDLGPPITATQAGIAALPPDFEPLPTGEALQEHWLKELPSGESEILKVLLEVYPETIDRHELGERAGCVAKSTRDAYISRLARRKLVVQQTRGGPVRANANLFG